MNIDKKATTLWRLETILLFVLFSIFVAAVTLLTNVPFLNTQTATVLVLVAGLATIVDFSILVPLKAKHTKIFLDQEILWVRTGKLVQTDLRVRWDRVQYLRRTRSPLYQRVNLVDCRVGTIADEITLPPLTAQQFELVERSCGVEKALTR